MARDTESLLRSDRATSSAAPRLDFDEEKDTKRANRRKPATFVQVTCAGCGAVATTPVLPGDWLGGLPLDWAACGADERGAWLKWCLQCQFERRHERQSQNRAITDAPKQGR